MVFETTTAVSGGFFGGDGSEMARRVLADWAKFRARFVKVFPNEYRRALKEIAARQIKEAA